jgi:uncharacterized protein with HEPN domain
LRKERLYLLDIVEACEKLLRYTQGVTFDQFVRDDILFDATVHNLQIIGEAVRSLPEEIRSLRPEIEWKRIVGLRHLLVHHYFGVDAEIVWDLALNQSPQLLEAAKDILAKTA